ncbi:prepilin-type N-terminal cleavage/methylation domain-containing protein [Deinococcus sp. RIT780]|uniref:prepilin-type N-terminal cleavage/methylation domain-containing protein n=1 Tax=Deinococcus sp. RIT780 TaxID=2870472 RepID=UPI001C8A1242|nr:prepilin-type N-terminal cleavage/methylation domain-containing protein [Deinococcus sp. RIT780]MBX8464251.1 prepilin-type N-terminal cleavage/methylation domain-containing protein [Deinococcus sp. RIT780]
MNPPATHRPAQGFTLIEVLIVMAVLGIVLAIAGNSLLGYLQSQQMREAAQQVAGDLERVRSGAMRYNRDATFEIISSTSYRMTVNGASETVTLPDSAQITSTPANAILTYSAPYSELSSAQATIVVKRTGSTKQTTLRTVGVTGKVVQDGS